ncbi:glycoside hydrolase family 19 protein [Actinoplanes subglobosus]|uniref:Glycoside hydrolase family 19 protein n=1 Tax=Actinoplanes subglobosus TaxID=1547892 RepID=A0ABV8IV91_9ACTN
MRRWMTAALLLAATLAVPTAAQAADTTTQKPPVGIATTKSGRGYWVAAADGGVFSFGDARFHGSMGGKTLNAPVVAIAATATGLGYWLTAADGGVFAFGDAAAKGSMGGKVLNAPVVGIAGTPSRQGYWLVASDGGIFAFGDAKFYGSMGGKTLNAPIRGIAATPTGLGYWLVASDGGVFAYGDAKFYGSMGGKTLNAPVAGISATPSGKGYWLVAGDGGIFAYGDARFYGSMGGQRLAKPVIGLTAVRNDGYLMIAADGGVFAFGAAGYFGRVVYSGSDGNTLPADATVTAAMLKEALGIPTTAAVTDGLPSLNAAMRRGNINSPARIAAFLSTLKAESGIQYNRLEVGCTAKSKSYYPYCGRGYIQLTLKGNYAAAGKYFQRDFVNNREETRSATYSAEIARWFWTVTHDLNTPADRLDMGRVTRAVNGTKAPAATLKARCTDFKNVLTYYRNHGGYTVDLNAVVCS